jgi:hypothetical protein
MGERIWEDYIRHQGGRGLQGTAQRPGVQLPAPGYGFDKLVLAFKMHPIL